MKKKQLAGEGVFDTRIKMIMFFLKGCKKYFALSVLFVFLLVLFDLVNPKMIGYTVDIIIGDMRSIPDVVIRWMNGIGGRQYLLHHLYLAAIMVVGIAFFGALCRYAFRLFNSMGAERLVKRMRDTLYEQIMHLPYSWQDVNKTGDIIQRCTSDVDMIKRFISEQMTSLFRMIVMISLSLFFMFRIHVTLALVASFFVPIVVLYSFFFHNKIGASFEKVDVEEGKLSAIVQENLTGVRVVRAFGRERYERDRFERKNEAYTNLWIDMMRILSTFWITNDIISGVQVIIILSLGAYFAVKGELSAGSYVAFLSYNGLFTFPVRQLGRVVSEMSKAGISVDRLRYIMNAGREEDEPGAVAYPGNGDIVFEHVSFKYPEETENNREANNVLKDVSFRIKKGQTVGVLGGTGSGKSTLIHLLDSVYEIPEGCGRITLNGVDIRNIQRKELRKHIGMVLQEPYLFSRTLEENIKIARSDAQHEDVEEVVRIASLDSSMERFKDGYDTSVGERGVTLSGGQKQRTAIAQMLIRQPDIMIFDDSLSAVDAETDAKIRTRLKESVKDTTTILIAHRITTLMNADMILVLEDGKIVEQGNHEQLVALNGAYKKIFDLQTGWESEGGVTE